MPWRNPTHYELTRKAHVAKRRLELRVNADYKGKVWDFTRKAVFLRDRYICANCGEITARPECDHVLPLARGGTNDPANLQTLCRPCHSRKTKLENG